VRRRAYKTSRAARFFWRPDGLPASAPDVVITGVGTHTLAPLRVAATVSSVSADGTTLTLSASLAATSRGLVGEGGTAVLDLGADGVHHVRLSHFATGTTVVLAEPLPPVSATAAGALDWNTWYADVGAGDVPAVATRNVLWSVTWSRDLGADAQPEPSYDDGFVDFVPRPFRTGLTDEDVYRVAPMLRGRLPAGWSSLEGWRDVALCELTEIIEAELLDSTQYVDMLLGEQFIRCHALLTAAVVADGLGLAGTARPDPDWRTLATECIARAGGNLRWLDADGDGVVDAGETGADARTPDALRSRWTTDSTYDSTLYDEDATGNGRRFTTRDDR